jgi:hypothetical protein
VHDDASRHLAHILRARSGPYLAVLAPKPTASADTVDPGHLRVLVAMSGITVAPVVLNALERAIAADSAANEAHIRATADARAAREMRAEQDAALLASLEADRARAESRAAAERDAEAAKEAVERQARVERSAHPQATPMPLSTLIANCCLDIMYRGCVECIKRGKDHIPSCRTWPVYSAESRQYRSV